MDHTCKTCKYEKDPCHYLCQECEDQINWESNISISTEAYKEILRVRKSLIADFELDKKLVDKLEIFIEALIHHNKCKEIE